VTEASSNDVSIKITALEQNIYNGAAKFGILQKGIYWSADIFQQDNLHLFNWLVNFTHLIKSLSCHKAGPFTYKIYSAVHPYSFSLRQPLYIWKVLNVNISVRMWIDFSENYSDFFHFLPNTVISIMSSFVHPFDNQRDRCLLVFNFLHIYLVGNNAVIGLN
jgi:hypothetical protein